MSPSDARARLAFAEVCGRRLQRHGRGGGCGTTAAPDGGSTSRSSRSPRSRPRADGCSMPRWNGSASSSRAQWRHASGPSRWDRTRSQPEAGVAATAPGKTAVARRPVRSSLRAAALTARTAQGASRSTCWAVLPMKSFPTGERRRRPMTRRSVSRSATTRRISSAAARPEVGCSTSCGSPASVSLLVDGLEVLGLCEAGLGVVAGLTGVDDDQGGAPQHRFVLGPFEGGHPLRRGDVAHHDGSAHPASSGESRLAPVMIATPSPMSWDCGVMTPARAPSRWMWMRSATSQT